MIDKSKDRMIKRQDVRTREGDEAPRRKIGELVIDGRTHAAKLVPSTPISSIPPKK